MNILHNFSRRLLASLALILPLATLATAQVAFDNGKLTITGDFSRGDVYSLKTVATSVEFGDDVTKIPDEAFNGFTKLTSVTFGKGITSVGSKAFYQTGLTEVYIPANITTWGTFAFGYSKLEKVTFDDAITTVYQSMLYNCDYLTDVHLPDNLITIEQSAFYGCGKLASITLPDKLERIDESAFGVSALTSIILPASLKYLNNQAFETCNDLVDIYILSNGTPDNKHRILLGNINYDNENECRVNVTGTNVFTWPGSHLHYDPTITWIGEYSFQNLWYYFQKDGCLIEETPLSVQSTQTSLQSPTSDTSAPAQYYDLTGRPVSPASHHGIAVKTQGNHSSLTIIK